MANEGILQIIPGMEAAADLSALQFHCVVHTTAANRVNQNTTDGGRIAGILQDKPSVVGQPATVARAGVSKAVLGGTVTAGDLLASDNVGRLILAAGGKAVVAQAISGGAINETHTVHLSAPGSIL